MNRISILSIVHSLPHYNVPLWMNLGRHPDIDLTLSYGTNFFGAAVQEGEDHLPSSPTFQVSRGPLTILKLGGKEVLWHAHGLRTLAQGRFDLVVHQLEAKFLSLPVAMASQKLRGGKMILWGKGDAGTKKSPVLDWFNRQSVKLADAAVFYDEAMRKRYIERGFPADSLFVAHNSLDLSPIEAQLGAWSPQEIKDFRHRQGLGDGPVLLNVGRIMERKRLDVLLSAAARLLPDFPGLKLVIVGEGPDTQRLRALAQRFGLEEILQFPGRIIGEENIAPWFLSCDAVVNPGSIGHLATHAHAYGRPLLTCDDRSMHGPEYEILVDGVTGYAFQLDDLHGLVRKLSILLRDKPLREEMGNAARLRAAETHGIHFTVNGFLRAAEYLTGRKLPTMTAAGSFIAEDA